ncbi:amidohydrolase family protein [Luteococcus sp. H138]|uniref:amidohydrolase n=1 Tax=unclassified Luteococcus TaxID=2639923 RepID=UPI00313B7B24
MVPAFTDAHAHPIMSLGLARGVDLSGCTSIGQLVGELSKAQSNLEADDWLLGWGLDPTCLDGEDITNELLHKALGSDRKAYVTLFDAHSAIASDPALALAGIDGPRDLPSGSIVIGDDGRPTGHLLEFDAMALLQPVLPVQTLPERVAALHGLLAQMAAQGIAEVHVLDMRDADVMELLCAAEEAGPLPVRLRLSPWCTPQLDDADCRDFIDRQGLGGQRWRVEGVKFFIDGTVEGGTAWLETPDSHGESTDSLWGGVRDYARRVAQFHAAGVPTATHAIGERGIREVVEVLAALPTNGVQHRIEHVESVGRDVIQQMGAAGIAVSMQPTHCTHHTHADGNDEWSRRLGPERAARAWCTRDVLDSGAVLALGSDYPVAPFEVLKIMADAQLRRPVDDPSVAPVLPDQALTAREVLAGFTTGPRAAIGESGGSLELGGPATFVVLDVDPLAVPAERLGTARVLLTLSEGLLTHEA